MTDNHQPEMAMEGESCVLCEEKGIKSQLKLFYLNFNETIKLCQNEDCCYPIGLGLLSDYIQPAATHPSRSTDHRNQSTRTTSSTVTKHTAKYKKTKRLSAPVLNVEKKRPLCSSSPVPHQAPLLPNSVPQAPLLAPESTTFDIDDFIDNHVFKDNSVQQDFGFSQQEFLSSTKLDSGQSKLAPALDLAEELDLDLFDQPVYPESGNTDSVLNFGSETQQESVKIYSDLGFVSQESSNVIESESSDLIPTKETLLNSESSNKTSNELVSNSESLMKTENEKLSVETLTNSSGEIVSTNDSTENVPEVSSNLKSDVSPKTEISSNIPGVIMSRSKSSDVSKVETSSKSCDVSLKTENSSKLSTLELTNDHSNDSSPTDVDLPNVLEDIHDDLCLQWPNVDALCWLDVTLCLLVHSQSLRKYVNTLTIEHVSIVKIMCIVYDQALSYLRRGHGSNYPSLKFMLGIGGGNIQALFAGGTKITSAEILESLDYLGLKGVTPAIARALKLVFSLNGDDFDFRGNCPFSSPLDDFNVDFSEEDMESKSYMARAVFSHFDQKLDPHLKSLLETNLKAEHPGVDFDGFYKSLQVINELRHCMFLHLQPRLKCKRGKNDSAMIAMMMLLHENGDIRKHFNIKFSWELTCDVCGEMKIDQDEKPLVGFPNTPFSFTMSSPYFERACYHCGAPEQRRYLKILGLSPNLVLHFMNGLPHCDMNKLDFIHQGELYSVIGVAQYKRNPDHFVAWIKDPAKNLWMECDGLCFPICSFNKTSPTCKPSEIHLVMWELKTQHSSTPINKTPTGVDSTPMKIPSKVDSTPFEKVPTTSKTSITNLNLKPVNMNSNTIPAALKTPTNPTPAVSDPNSMTPEKSEIIDETSIFDAIESLSVEVPEADDLALQNFLNDSTTQNFPISHATSISSLSPPMSPGMPRSRRSSLAASVSSLTDTSPRSPALSNSSSSLANKKRSSFLRQQSSNSSDAPSSSKFSLNIPTRPTSKFNLDSHLPSSMRPSRASSAVSSVSQSTKAAGRLMQLNQNVQTKTKSYLDLVKPLLNIKNETLKGGIKKSFSSYVPKQHGQHNLEVLKNASRKRKYIDDLFDGGREETSSVSALEENYLTVLKSEKSSSKSKVSFVDSNSVLTEKAVKNRNVIMVSNELERRKADNMLSLGAEPMECNASLQGALPSVTKKTKPQSGILKQTPRTLLQKKKQCWDTAVNYQAARFPIAQLKTRKRPPKMDVDLKTVLPKLPVLQNQRVKEMIMLPHKKLKLEGELGQSNKKLKLEGELGQSNKKLKLEGELGQSNKKLKLEGEPGQSVLSHSDMCSNLQNSAASNHSNSQFTKTKMFHSVAKGVDEVDGLVGNLRSSTAFGSNLAAVQGSSSAQTQFKIVTNIPQILSNVAKNSQQLPKIIRISQKNVDSNPGSSLACFQGSKGQVVEDDLKNKLKTMQVINLVNPARSQELCVNGNTGVKSTLANAAQVDLEKSSVQSLVNASVPSSSSNSTQGTPMGRMGTSTSSIPSNPPMGSSTPKTTGEAVANCLNFLLTKM